MPYSLRIKCVPRNEGSFLLLRQDAYGQVVIEKIDEVVLFGVEDGILLDKQCEFHSAAQSLGLRAFSRAIGCLIPLDHSADRSLLVLELEACEHAGNLIERYGTIADSHLDISKLIVLCMDVQEDGLDELFWQHGAEFELVVFDELCQMLPDSVFLDASLLSKLLDGSPLLEEL
jgi:hypothetical protein